MKIDRDRRTVTFDGQTLRLPPTQFDTLEYLAAHPGVIRSRAQIMQVAFEGGGRENRSDRCVDSVIKLLRKQGIPGIHSYWGAGYYWELPQKPPADLT